MPKFIKFPNSIKKSLFNKTPLLTISALILGTVLAFGLQVILAQVNWTGPTYPPPKGGIVNFLTTGTESQTKKGSLQIGDETTQSSLTVRGGITTGGTISSGTDISSGGNISSSGNISG